MKKSIGGNSGYIGYSKSVRAVQAEKRGLVNKSQINKDFIDIVNSLIKKNKGTIKVTVSQVKNNLDRINADEWHHTSKFGNKTYYYSAETIADYFNDYVSPEEKAYEKWKLKCDNLKKDYYKLDRQICDYVLKKVKNNKLGYETKSGVIVDVHFNYEIPYKRVINYTGKMADKYAGYYVENGWDIEDKNVPLCEKSLKEANAARLKAIESMPKSLKLRLDKFKEKWQKLQAENLYNKR